MSIIIKSGASTNTANVDASNNLQVNINAVGAGTIPVSTTPSSDIISTGTISSNGTSVAVNTEGSSSVVFNVTGTWTGTLQPQYQLADNSWVNGGVFPTLPFGTSVTTITANGQWKTNVAGFKSFRLLSTAFSSGTATINLEASQGQTSIQSLIYGSTGNAVDGTAGSPSTGVLTIQGTGSGTAVPVSFSGNVTVVGTDADNATNSTTKVPTIPARANAAAPTWTEGHEAPLSVDLAGNLRTAFGGSLPSGTNTIGKVDILGNAGATLDQAPGSAIPTNALFVGGSDGTNLRAISMDNTGQVKVLVQNTPSVTVTGTVAVTQSTTPWTIQGDSASGAANAGNPVKTGGVFNTTQPTVTNGQTVDSQSTARGGTIVATGVDTFNVTVNTALPAGSNVIGHVITDSGSTTVITGTVAVTQSTSPWVENLTQVAGVALGATAVTNFGTAPAATAVPGVNASIYAGTTGITATGSSLNANVTNTVNVSAAQSGNWTTRIVGNAGATLDGTVAAGTAPTNALAILGQFNTTIPTPTAAQTVSLQTDSTGALAINTEGRKTTYRVGVVAFTPIASATAPTISITGSATKTVRITRIVFSSSAATGTISDLQLLRFSALTGGTANSQAANVAKMDTNNAAQTAVVNQWSAAATTATSAGILNAKRYEVVTAAVSVQPGEIEWLFGNDNGQGLVLRGTGDFAGVRISAVGTTPVADCWVEWTEE